MQQDQRKKTIGILCAILSQFLFGLSFLFTKKITLLVSPISLLGWRYIIALASILLCRALGLIQINLKGKKLLPLILIGLMQPVLYFFTETLGIKLTTASESGVMIACIPISTMVFSTLLLKEKPSKLQVLGISVSLAGVLASVLAKGMEASFNPLGYGMLFIAICSAGLAVTFIRRAKGFSSAEITYVMILLGTLVFNSAALIENTAAGTLTAYLSLPFQNADFLLSILYLGALCSVVAFFVSTVAINTLGPNGAASFVGLSTVVSVFSGLVFLRESFSFLQFLCMLFILFGVYLANLTAGRRGLKA